jgi:hypothetical protein
VSDYVAIHNPVESSKCVSSKTRAWDIGIKKKKKKKKKKKDAPTDHRHLAPEGQPALAVFARVHRVRKILIRKKKGNEGKHAI